VERVGVGGAPSAYLGEPIQHEARGANDKTGKVGGEYRYWRLPEPRYVAQNSEAALTKPLDRIRLIGV